jgi:hypothetical protein
MRTLRSLTSVAQQTKRLPKPLDLCRADENRVVRQLDDMQDGKAGCRQIERLTQGLPEAPLRDRWRRSGPDHPPAWLVQHAKQFGIGPAGIVGVHRAIRRSCRKAVNDHRQLAGSRAALVVKASNHIQGLTREAEQRLKDPSALARSLACGGRRWPSPGEQAGACPTGD